MAGSVRVGYGVFTGAARTRPVRVKVMALLSHGARKADSDEADSGGEAHGTAQGIDSDDSEGQRGSGVEQTRMARGRTSGLRERRVVTRTPGRVDARG